MLRDIVPIPRAREIRAVTFDCWNTLIEAGLPPPILRQHGELLCELLRPHGHEPSPEQALAALEAARRRHGEGMAAGVASGSPEIAGWALESFGVEDTRAQQQLGTRLQNAAFEWDVRALQGAPETLARLRERGIRRGLICDTGLAPGQVVRALLDRLGLLGDLEVLIFSDEAGVPKPDPGLFHSALAGLEAAPEQAVHIGDTRSTDIAGARGVGMASVRIRVPHDDRTEGPEADAVADSHLEIRALLDLG
jgi:putative hydrolase of the HAD superfamily